LTIVTAIAMVFVIIAALVLATIERMDIIIAY